MNTVKIVLSEKGELYHSYNDSLQCIKVEQYRNLFDKTGRVKNTLVQANIIGTVDDLMTLATEMQMKSDLVLLPGKIIIKESIEPFNKNKPEEDLKIDYTTGKPCMTKGKVIYSKCFYTPNLSIQDELINHDN